MSDGKKQALTGEFVKIICPPKPEHMSGTAPDIYPCQLRNKRLTGGDTTPTSLLTSAQKKSAEALRLEFGILIDRVGLEPLLFVTFTFPDPLPDRKTREAFYEKLRKYVLSKNFAYGFTVFDRSKTGQPHYHIVAVGREGSDFHNGFDFCAWDASRSAEKKWNQSDHTDHAAAQRCREMTARYSASASLDLRATWTFLNDSSRPCGFGRVNAAPIMNPKGCGFYLGKCVTNGFRLNHPDDRGIRRVRYWGNFPRKVTLPFYRTTKAATRWRGRLAFCGRVLGFNEFGDFAKCFGRFWFIHLKGIIRMVPTPVAEASLLTANLPLNLIATHREKIKKIEIELLDRLERYGRILQATPKL